MTLAAGLHFVSVGANRVPPAHSTAKRTYDHVRLARCSRKNKAAHTDLPLSVRQPYCSLDIRLESKNHETSIRLKTSLGGVPEDILALCLPGTPLCKASLECPDILPVRTQVVQSVHSHDMGLRSEIFFVSSVSVRVWIGILNRCPFMELVEHFGSFFSIFLFLVFALGRFTAV